MPTSTRVNFSSFNGLMWASAPTKCQLAYLRDRPPELSSSENEIQRTVGDARPYEIPCWFVQKSQHPYKPQFIDIFVAQNLNSQTRGYPDKREIAPCKLKLFFKDQCNNLLGSDVQFCNTVCQSNRFIICFSKVCE